MDHDCTINRRPASASLVGFFVNVAVGFPGYDRQADNQTAVSLASVKKPASPGDQSPGLPNTVNIKDYKFVPGNISITKGEAINWVNLDRISHTATGKGFDSGNMGNGQTFSFKFDEAGTFDYVCAYHPGMDGRVTVK